MKIKIMYNSFLLMVSGAGIAHAILAMNSNIFMIAWWTTIGVVTAFIIIEDVEEKLIKAEDIPLTPDTLNALYQEILARKIVFPGEIREVFHEAMNRLSDQKKQKEDNL